VAGSKDAAEVVQKMKGKLGALELEVILTLGAQAAKAPSGR
jgi:hypothetical protein